jgi:DNA-binding beta-propeller fold protein YncE
MYSKTGLIYDVRYNTEPITPSTFTHATLVDSLYNVSSPGTELSAEVEGLTPNTTYYFALVVCDQSGNHSSLSNVATVQTGPMFHASIGSVYGGLIEVNSDGSFYSAHDGANEIYRYDPSGQLEWFHSDRTVNDIAGAPDGEVFLITRIDDVFAVQRLHSDGTIADEFTIGTGQTPKEIAYDKMSESVYVANSLNVRRYDLDGTLQAEWPLVSPSCRAGDTGGLLKDLEVDYLGNVYALLNPQASQEACPHVVYVYDRNGGIVSHWGQRSEGASSGYPEPGDFYWPHGMALSPDGLVYIGDFSGHVQVFTLAGEFVTMWSTAYGPEDLDIDGNGDVYVFEFSPSAWALNVYR